ncbi:CocE/NonD family hydrolase [Streptomyces caeni]|uniref:CocE/NonD family hydrolase n=1 Tax=Streptomyces caeni TaxID=2307231 RepID=A0ABW4IPI1_9ACTN
MPPPSLTLTSSSAPCIARRRGVRHRRGAADPAGTVAGLTAGHDAAHRRRRGTGAYRASAASPTAGPRDNSSLEARHDVLTFTRPPMTEPVDILGPVSARLTVSTDTGHADVFSRPCDVDAQGRSVNICDGLGRLRADGQEPSRITVPMSSTAHRFAVGHRIRWQISKGAHPRYARNPGNGTSAVDTTTFTPVRLTLHAESALTLATHARSSGLGPEEGG